MNLLHVISLFCTSQVIFGLHLGPGKSIGPDVAIESGQVKADDFERLRSPRLIFSATTSVIIVTNTVTTDTTCYTVPLAGRIPCVGRKKRDVLLISTIPVSESPLENVESVPLISPSRTYNFSNTTTTTYQDDESNRYNLPLDGFREGRQLLPVLPYQVVSKSFTKTSVFSATWTITLGCTINDATFSSNFPLCP